MKENENILLIANYQKLRGGISAQVLNLYNALTSDGYNVEIFNTKGNYLKRAFMFFPLLKKSYSYNVLHAHGCSDFGFFPILLTVIIGIILRKKKIITFHGGGADVFLRKHNWWATSILKKANNIIVMSSYLESVFTKYSIQTKVVPNIFEKDCYLSKKNYTYPKIISIRSLESIYNIDDIIRSFSIIKVKYPKASLKIVGDGSKRQSLEKLVENLRLADVTFSGRINNDRIVEALQDSNIFISASSFDNQPFSILEAFICGLPVIATNIGGIPDMIQNGVNGLLFKPKNYKEIVHYVDWIMKNKRKTQNIIRNGKDSLAHYSWDEQKDVMKYLYDCSKRK